MILDIIVGLSIAIIGYIAIGVIVAMVISIWYYIETGDFVDYKFYYIVIGTYPFVLLVFLTMESIRNNIENSVEEVNK